MGAVAARQPLADLVASVSWYQSLALPDGVVTPGAFKTVDELRRLPFPASLEGKRCLDIATSDGFWAFEMERRGAAEVVATDVSPDDYDWPGNATSEHDDRWSERTGFDIAHDAYHSRVKWRELSVYELDPDLIGRFDFVFMGSVLGHLRDPARALRAAATVLSGELLSVDAISTPLTVFHPRQSLARFEAPGWPLWWVPNLAAYRKLFASAGLNIVENGSPFFLKRGPTYAPTYGANVDRRPPPMHRRIKQAVGSKLGNLHAWVRATSR